MKTEILLTEAEIANEFAEALEARDLPEKFFYWFPLSVRSWRAVAAQPAYSALDALWAEVAGRVPGMVSHFETAEIPVISYGSGDGRKDRIVLNALRSSSKPVKYFPVDASQALLEIACAASEDDEIETLGIKADISSRMHLLLAADAAEAPRLFLMSGNTLGGFDPLDQIKNVADAMRPGDRLIIDGELESPESVETPASEAGTRFAFAPLASVGFTAEDGRIRFEQKRDKRHPGLCMVSKRFLADRDLRITVSAEDVSIARGEHIFMNFRYLYSPEAFTWLNEKQGGLKVLEEHYSPDRRFVTAVCSKEK